jgi:hypothetical protein
LRVYLVVGGITAARDGLKPACIQDAEIATVVRNEATPLRARRVRDSHPSHAEHLGQKIMCHVESVGVRAAL